MTEPASFKSRFKYGGQYLHELSHPELLEAVDAIWSRKNDEIETLRAQNKGLELLLKGPWPVHQLWRSFADNAYLLVFVGLVAYLLGGAGA